MGGVPTRACRRFIRRLSDEKKLPVYVFTDGDPYGYMSIYRTLKVGSGNAAHINQYFCVIPSPTLSEIHHLVDLSSFSRAIKFSFYRLNHFERKVIPSY